MDRQTKTNSADHLMPKCAKSSTGWKTWLLFFIIITIFFHLSPWEIYSSVSLLPNMTGPTPVGAKPPQFLFKKTPAPKL